MANNEKYKYQITNSGVLNEPEIGYNDIQIPGTLDLTYEEAEYLKAKGYNLEKLTKHEIMKGKYVNMPESPFSGLEERIMRYVNAKEDKLNKGRLNGYCPLGGNGKVPAEFIDYNVKSPIKVVETIEDRDNINGSYIVYVIDASADPTVNSGSASYAYDETRLKWVKLGEYESMDVEVLWNVITGRPTTAPEILDETSQYVIAHRDILNRLSVDEVTGLPLWNASSWPIRANPDAMLKTTYDVDNDGVVDVANTAKSVEYSNVNGKPATRPEDIDSFVTYLNSVKTKIDAIGKNVDGNPTWNGGHWPISMFPGTMLKTDFDVDGDGIVDRSKLADVANSVTWEHVSGKPTGIMIHEGYDFNGDGVVDKADVATRAESVEWDNVTNKPLDSFCTKAVYDADGDGVIDHAKTAGSAASVNWGDIKEKPELMSAGVYDTNNDGIVDKAYSASFADSVEWNDVKNKPEDFMLKKDYDKTGDFKVDHARMADVASSVAWESVENKPEIMFATKYDTNNDGIVDRAKLADSVAWANVTDKPTSIMDTSVYDTTSNGVVDRSEVSNSTESVDWANVQNVPGDIMHKADFDADGDGIVDVALLANGVAWDNVTDKPNLMDRTVYDSDDDGVVDVAKLAESANSVAWENVGNKPTGFMLTSVYDIDGDGIVDRSQLANAVEWVNVNDKPTVLVDLSEVDGKLAYKGTVVDTTLDGSLYLTKDGSSAITGNLLPENTESVFLGSDEKKFHTVNTRHLKSASGTLSIIADDIVLTGNVTSTSLTANDSEKLNSMASATVATASSIVATGADGQIDSSFIKSEWKQVESTAPETTSESEPHNVELNNLTHITNLCGKCPFVLKKVVSGGTLTYWEKVGDDKAKIQFMSDTLIRVQILEPGEYRINY